jgi:PAS domain S-box-containing protein
MRLDEEFATTSPPALSRPSSVRLAPVWILVAGLLASTVLLLSLRSAEQAAARSDFELLAKDRIASVRRDLAGDVEQVHSIVALFDSSQAVEPQEFETFTAGSAERHPSLVALLWADEVEGEHGAAYPIRYGAGTTPLARASGQDLGEDPELRAILASALESGDLVATGRLPAGVVGEDRTVVMIALKSQRYATRGLVCGVIDVERLLAEGRDPEGLALAVSDADGETFLGAAAPPAAHPAYSEELRFANRSWRITAALPPGRTLSAASWTSWAAFLAGLLVTGLLVATVLSATSQARIRDLVERRTRELQRSYDTLAEESKARIWAVSETRQLEKRLREIIDLVPDMIWVADRHGRFLLANQATADAYGTTVGALTTPGNVDVNADAVEPGEELRRDRELMEKGLATVDPESPFVDAKGRRRILHKVKIPCKVFGESEAALLCVATDITEQKHARDVLQAQNRVLRELAQGAEPERVLAGLVTSAEAIVPGMRCSILLMAPDGRHLLHGYAPNLPAYYNEAVDGIEIGPTVGSCGAAASRGERVVVRDVRSHANWAAFREIATRAGIRASWSQPIRGSEGNLLGTFAMYYPEPRTPEPFEEKLLESMANMAGIAIERGKLVH